MLIERCEHAFARARSGRGESTSVAALFIDLDGFKPINDRAGHDTGDQVLIAVAADLLATLRPTDTVARIGGDEFVVLLEQDDGLAYLRTVAERITTTIRRQVTTDTDSLTLSASVGIARVDLAREPEVSPEQLLRRADSAMYRAKERGRDQYDVFDTDLLERTEAREELVQAIRDGLRHDRVALVFQPVVDVDSNLVVGAEALMRLSNAEGRLLPTLPAVVAAEAAGLAELLGDRVLHLALGEARTWPEHMTLAVNISARELTGRDLRSRVEQALQRHDFDPARLILEITESSILSAGPSALAELEKLRERGVRVAIDDFGTAYATLANLTTLPVDVLKVDMSFTAGLPHQRTHTAIVHGIASMAYELDIPCIIEGVETDMQLDAIRGMSVQAQGWFWGKPQGPGTHPDAQPRAATTRPERADEKANAPTLLSCDRLVLSDFLGDAPETVLGRAIDLAVDPGNVVTALRCSAIRCHTPDRRGRCSRKAWRRYACPRSPSLLPRAADREERADTEDDRRRQGEENPECWGHEDPRRFSSSVTLPDATPA